MKLDFLIPYIKINLKWTLDLNVKAKTIKLLGENKRVSFHDPDLGNSFLDLTPKPQATKLKKKKKKTSIEIYWT